ncbi:DENN domain-containing protein 2A isoform X2 [Ambystoma mexicanum]|uniref:DENN domain-containing protein 2A isoform X2 n=1 Tax=Ambystoma mexicanum TaxID=8296 RepID=UPI0037E86FB4
MPRANAMTAGGAFEASKTSESCTQLPQHSHRLVDRKSTETIKESGRHLGVPTWENFCDTAIVPRGKVTKPGADCALERSPLKLLANLLRPPGLVGLEQDMLRNRMLISEPTMDLGAKEPNKILRRQLGSPQRPPPPNKANEKKVCNIKDKISEWEGKRETPSPLLSRKEVDWGKKNETAVPSVTEKAGERTGHRTMPPRKLLSRESESKENDARTKQPEKKLERKEIGDKGESTLGKSTDVKSANKRESDKDIPSVLCQVKMFEQVLKEGPTEVAAQFPGTYYSPQCLQEKAVEEQSSVGGQDRLSSGQQRRPFNVNVRGDEPVFGTVGEGDSRASGVRGQDYNSENAYTEPGVPEQKPFINPLPKPRRTFRHDGEEEVGLRPTAGYNKEKRSLPPLPSMPPPPLPSSPPPAVSRRRWNGKHKANADNRKSYEFEDLPQSALENHRADWCAQNKILTRTLSEENVYEDILDTPSKENPYEDIEIDGQFLGKKYSSLQTSPTSSAPTTPNKINPKPTFFRQNSDRRSFKLLELRKVNRDGAASPSRGTSPPPSIPSSPDEALFNSGDLQNGRRRRRIPRLVLKINAIFEARRGKKRVKRLSQSTESSSGKDDNSESDSDTEEKLKAHSRRLVHVKSRLSQTPRYQTLERELLEYRKRQLFEYFVVVSLKKPVGDLYTPEVTQQFPLKLERSFKFMREAEDQLKAIPQFCFPDVKDWRPVDQFTSETFSFVLTGEDGSRRFGYCRRLLPGNKGKRLPEVYCIVSRLGCFNLFSKILDEVEKRRSISPALVQPFMRSIIEAPFPALGRTITVKNFLPGSGNEVIELYRPLDSRLEHVDFESLFASLSIRHLLRVFATLLLERRVIFMADTLSTLSKCCHAVVALIYPFAWQHTYIPVLPPSMIDIVCSPTPFLIGLLSSSLPRLKELPVEEVLVVDLVHNRFLRQMDDEDSILPRKLQAALEQILEQRNELFIEWVPGPLSARQDSSPLNEIVSESFVRFFVEVVGHYSLFLIPGEREEKTLHREAFRKSVSSKSLRRFLEVFMETQMFGGFIQERELQKQGSKGLFEVRAQEYLETLPSSKQRGVDKFLKGLGNRIRLLHKK